MISEVFNRFILNLLEGKSLRILQVGDYSLTAVSKFELKDCSALETVQIGEKAFWGCTSLKLNNAVELESIEIGSEAFSSGRDFVLDASDRLLVFSIGDSVMTEANDLILSGRIYGCVTFTFSGAHNLRHFEVGSSSFRGTTSLQLSSLSSIAEFILSFAAPNIQGWASNLRKMYSSFNSR